MKTKILSFLIAANIMSHTNYNVTRQLYKTLSYAAPITTIKQKGLYKLVKSYEVRALHNNNHNTNSREIYKKNDFEIYSIS